VVAGTVSTKQAILLLPIQRLRKKLNSPKVWTLWQGFQMQSQLLQRAEDEEELYSIVLASDCNKADDS